MVFTFYIHTIIIVCFGFFFFTENNMKTINIIVLKFLFLLSCIITNAIIVGHAYNILRPENFGAIGDGKANDWHG